MDLFTIPSTPDMLVYQLAGLTLFLAKTPATCLACSLHVKHVFPSNCITVGQMTR